TYDISISGDHAFVADGEQGFNVIDISDPTNPTYAGGYNTPGWAVGVTVTGDYAFVADELSGLQIIDITDPASPDLIGTYDTPGLAVGVAVSGDHAFVADYEAGLHVIDISDPTSPTLAGSYADEWPIVTGLAISGDNAFVIDDFYHLRVIDISEPTNPTLAGNCGVMGVPNDIAVSGDFAFVTSGYTGLQVIDISDPTSPSLAGSYDTGDLAESVAVSGDLAFVGTKYSQDNVSVIVFDISDPASPDSIGTYFTTAYSDGYDIEVAGDYAFVGTGWTEGIHVIRAYGREADAVNNVGQSLAVDGSVSPILGARMTSTQTTGVTWELSADAGSNWQAFTPGEVSSAFSVPGNDLLWRSTHTWSPGLNPTVSDLAIDWLTESSLITSITDIPDDQGGWVRVSFTRSGFDFADEDSLPVTGYGVYRRVDDLALKM
ncbi:MAG: hypothetical protein GY722_29665, partial [bacterium]|nr:hypothetical protein [bacterium]